MRHHVLIRLPIILALACLFSGCLAPRRDEYHSHRPINALEPSPESDRLWAASLETLRRGGFRLDRVDRPAGLMTTFPETSQSFFEVWRHDVNTWSDLSESSLNPMRRWVEVHLSRSEIDGWCDLAVVVHKQRLSSPDRQFNSTGAAFQFFGDSLPSTTGQPRISAKDERWFDRGRDGAMEEYLLRKILGRAGLDSVNGEDLAARNALPAEAKQGVPPS